MAKIKMQININDSFANKIQEDLDEQVKEVTLQIKNMVEDLKDATPKRTGYAASRWEFETAQRYKVSFSLKNTFIINIDKEINYFITNDAPYISYLNAGSSIQAPAYFVEQTILNNGFVPT